MCGIFALLGNQSNTLTTKELDRLFHLIDQRGPDDCSGIRNFETKCGLQLILRASVLHLRGQVMQKQPIVDDNNNILMFNGQIYGFTGEQIGHHVADTTFLSEKLNLCRDNESIVNTFEQIDGPFAFIYWNDRLNSLFYGRDVFGRKSLCEYSCETGDSIHPLIISSVATQTISSSDNHSWREVDCKKITCINFSNRAKPDTHEYHWNLDDIYPRPNRCPPISNQKQFQNVIKFKAVLPLNSDLKPAEDFNHVETNSAVDELEFRLLGAVKTRIKYNRETCLICRQISQTALCSHSKFAVAFSGGIDSTLLALAVDKLIDIGETIDLITVAFKDNSPDRSSVASAFLELRKLCPNRRWLLVLCDISLTELQQERRDKIADLIAPCNTVLDDSLGCACWFIGRARGRAMCSRIADDELISIFDALIGYNPSYAHSAASSIFVTDQYTSPASMIFVGSSIDEQLGGYGSHRAAWKESGSIGVLDEISFLMRRLSTRNLGRDDRVYSHHGRDIKLPFLDFNFVSFLNGLPLGLKMNLNESSDIGPKKLLRQLALRWGLEETGRRVKRALQFGTRIANLEHPGERGGDVCSRLQVGQD